MEKKLTKEKKQLNVKAVVDVLEKLVPPDIQEEWDNSGIQIGFQDKPVNKILTCLEIDKRVVDEAKTADVDMIISHHPLIFSGIKSFQDTDYKDSMIMDIISSGISVYSCHTPFDKVKGGNNDVIMKKLGLCSIDSLNGDDIGRTGEFKTPITFKKAIEMVATELEMSIRQLKAVGEPETMITKVGCCTGAGADLINMACEDGCQMFITGDVKYHEAQDAMQAGICVLDAGHYGTEKFFREEMKKLLDKKLDGKVEIIASEISLDPFEIL